MIGNCKDMFICDYALNEMCCMKLKYDCGDNWIYIFAIKSGKKNGKW